MGTELSYLENDNSHRNHADTLGQLQRGIDKGTITANTPHAHYIGVELVREFPGARGAGESFLKKDCTGSGTGNSQRSKNRVIVKVKGGKVVEGEAWLWRHDNRILKLGPGFFTRARMMRNM